MNTTKKKCSTKVLVIILIVSVLVIAGVIIGAVIGTQKKDSDKNIETYYLSERICYEERGQNVCYRKINVNYEHYIFNLTEDVSRIHVNYKNRYGIKIASRFIYPKKP